MLKSETREIGGKRYCVTQLASEPGQRLFFTLAKLIGPSMVELLKQWNGQAVSPTVAAAALAELVKQFSYADFRDFVDTFMESTQLVGDKERVALSKVRALAFAGDYGSLVKWLAFCLEVNFGSFFGDMGLTVAPSDAGEPSA